MGTIVENDPVNPAQVLAALPAADSCMVREDAAHGTYEVEVEGHGPVELAAVVAGIVYDDTITSPDA